MSLLSPRNQLIACLLLAGVGLALFFGGGYRDLPLLADLPMAWIGSVIFVADVTPLVGFTDDLGALAAAIAMTSAYINEDVKRKTSEKLLSWFGSN